MPRYFLTSSLIASLSTFVHAKNIADCRVVTGGATECNPYGSKIIQAKEIKYESDSKKLIISKTLPLPEKPKARVIPIEKMIEKYVKVEDSLRFKRTHDEKPEIEVVEDVVPEIVIPEEVVKKAIADVSPEKKEVASEKIVEAVPKPAPAIVQEKLIKEKLIKKEIILGYYKVVSGDVLSRIAKKFGLSIKELTTLNSLDKKKPLRLGQSLRIPMDQKRIDAIAKGQYIVEPNDTLITIARKFNVDTKELVRLNKIKTSSTIRVGKKLALPLPYILKKREAEKKRLAVKLKREKAKKLKMMRGFEKRKLRVTATAYTSHRNQTDSTPFLAAWNNRLRPGMKIIAVSRDMLKRYGMRNGTKVRIGGLRGHYIVRDKMNKRYKKRIDIYMGMDKRRALRWGRRSVVIYW